MSKKLEALERKAREAKNGNALVGALQKFVAGGGSPDVVSDVVSGATIKLHPAHFVSLLFVDAYANKEISKLGETLIEKALEGADFQQKIAVAAIISEFRDKQEGASVAESAFEEIEGTGDYLFFAVSGVGEVVLNSSVYAIDGNGKAPISVGDYTYKLSTIESVYEDLVAMRDSLSDSEFASHCIALAQCFYRIGDEGKGDQLYIAAIDAVTAPEDVMSLFYAVGELEKPGQSVDDPVEWVVFPSQEIRERLRKMAQSRLTGDELEGALDSLR